MDFYNEKTWKDSKVQYPSRRRLTDIDTGNFSVVQVSKEPGTIYETGDEWNASVMNDLEQRISTAFDNVSDTIDSSASETRKNRNDAEAYAVGTREGVDVPNTDITYRNNAKYYASFSEQVYRNVSGSVSDAKTYADKASVSAQTASSSALNARNSEQNVRIMHDEVNDAYENVKEDATTSEAYVAGTRNGVPVSEDDPAYHNNVKYYIETGGGGGTLVDIPKIVVIQDSSGNPATLSITNI